MTRLWAEMMELCIAAIMFVIAVTLLLGGLLHLKHKEYAAESMLKRGEIVYVVDY